MYQRLRDLPAPMDKVNKLRAYLEQHKIKDVVVGVSGGIDSAVVLGLLTYIPNITIHAVMIDFDLYGKVFDPQYQRALMDHYSEFSRIQWHEYNLSAPFNYFMNELEVPETMGVDANVSYAMRYLAFFALAQQYDGITIGTTNLDEMGYVGWFGKTSDMMVDIQPIADLHKYEVVEYANIMGLPKKIIERAPTGDLLDGSSDEENFGCSYKELAYLTCLYLDGGEFDEQVKQHFAKAIALHEKNAHKYQGQTFNPIYIR